MTDQMMDDAAVRVSGPAELQDVKLSTKTNGATYDVVFEIGVDTFFQLVRGGDGHEVTFRDVYIGSGALVRRGGLTRDADSGKHFKIAITFAQSEIRRAFGQLGDMVADNTTRGQIDFEPTQITVDEMLTKKADDDE